MGDRPSLAAEQRRLALRLAGRERTAVLVLAALALGVGVALGSPLVAGAAVLLAAAGFAGNRFLSALGAAAVALNPGWGLLFILATPYLILAVVLAYRARRDYESR